MSCFVSYLNIVNWFFTFFSCLMVFFHIIISWLNGIFLFILSSSCVYYLLSYFLFFSFLFFSFLFILFYFFSLFFIGPKAQILAQFGLKMQPTIASNSPTAKAQLPGQHKPKPAAFFFPSRVKHLPTCCFPFLPRTRLVRWWLLHWPCPAGWPRFTPHVVSSFNHQTTPAPFQDKKEDTRHFFLPYKKANSSHEKEVGFHWKGGEPRFCFARKESVPRPQRKKESCHFFLLKQRRKKSKKRREEARAVRSLHDFPFSLVL